MNEAPQLSLRTTERDGRYTISLSGELDLAATPLLRTRVAPIPIEEARAITLDLRRLDFIDSSGLHAILEIRAMCETHGCRFGLVPGPPSVQRLFDVTRLTDVLPFVEPSEDHALP